MSLNKQFNRQLGWLVSLAVLGCTLVIQLISYDRVTPEPDIGLHAIGVALLTKSDRVVVRPSVFIRYADIEPRGPFGFLSLLSRRVAHIGGYYDPPGIAYITFSVSDKKGRAINQPVDILLAGFGSCSRPIGAKEHHEVSAAEYALTDTPEIQYLSESTSTSLFSPVEVPRRFLRRVHLASTSVKEIDCMIAVTPQRVSFSRRYLLVDSIFVNRKTPQGNIAFPMTMRIAPPYSSVNWSYDGEELMRAPPRKLSVSSDALPLIRSDFPALLTYLTPSEPTIGVGWEYEEADETREVVLVFVGALAGALISLLASLPISKASSR